jgi:hypothetical protein
MLGFIHGFVKYTSPGNGEEPFIRGFRDLYSSYRPDATTGIGHPASLLYSDPYTERLFCAQYPSENIFSGYLNRSCACLAAMATARASWAWATSMA